VGAVVDSTVVFVEVVTSCIVECMEVWVNCSMGKLDSIKDTSTRWVFCCGLVFVIWVWSMVVTFAYNAWLQRCLTYAFEASVCNGMSRHCGKHFFL